METTSQTLVRAPATGLELSPSMIDFYLILTSLPFQLGNFGNSVTKMQQKKSNKICIQWSEFKWSGCPVFKWHSITGPFGVQPSFDHSNTKLAWYSHPLCVPDNLFDQVKQKKLPGIRGAMAKSAARSNHVQFHRLAWGRDALVPNLIVS